MMFSGVRYRTCRLQMVCGQMALQHLEGLRRRVGAMKLTHVARVNRSPFQQRFEIKDAIPVVRTVEDDLNLLGELFGLHQRENLGHLVKRAEAPGKDHQRLGEIGKPELPHEEVTELEVEPLRDVGIRSLLGREPDVEADRLAPGLLRAPVGRLHDAGAAAGGHHEAVGR